MTKEHHVVAQVKLFRHQPTALTFDDLYTWVIWQFPRNHAGGKCGAVRPPVVDHDWYPAIIHAKEKRVQVHAHLEKTFATPETAADFLENKKS